MMLSRRFIQALEDPGTGNARAGSIPDLGTERSISYQIQPRRWRVVGTTNASRQFSQGSVAAREPSRLLPKHLFSLHGVHTTPDTQLSHWLPVSPIVVPPPPTVI